ncbi:TrmH family RNA methyltransferase, partial [Saccharomonospora halophila]|uniref:TrmH family RNA methyltransferase n=1 Tax=Saccharomonospora halophila TaxID=129922 RepID=UPI000367F2A8
VVVPHRGVAALDPLVVKASAGVAFRAPVLRCATAGEAVERLTESGYAVYALGARPDTAPGVAVDSLFTCELPARTAFVLGGETQGVGTDVTDLVAGWVSIPMPGEVESLNVSSAAAVVCFELVRRARSR